jgi:Tfp pilus assembly protein PilN
MSGWNFARRPFQDDRPAFGVAALLVLFGLALLIANFRLFTQYRRGVADVKDDIAALEARQARADEKARAAKTALSSYRLSSMADESRELSRIAAERRFSWTALLSRLERTLPSDVGITRLQPQFGKEGGTVLEMQLVARNREPVVPTIAALARDPWFGGVELKSESVVEGATAGTEPFTFQISSHYTPEVPK